MYINWLFLFLGIYLIASLAALVSEKSGSVNISIEGTMIFGGTIFVLMMRMAAFQPTGSMASFGLYIALIISALGGVVLSAVYSYATVNFMSDQIIVGTAINILTPALGFILIGGIVGNPEISVGQTNWYLYAANDVNGFNISFMTFMLIAIGLIIIFWTLLNKTRWGLRLKSAGENPYALETSGISVAKTRWIANAIVGGLAGIAGGMAVATFLIWGQSVNGMGYIAIAILIFGQWRIEGIAIGSLIMSALFAVVRSNSFPPSIPREVLNIIPFVLPLVILVFLKLSSEEKISKRSKVFFENRLSDNKDLYSKAKKQWSTMGFENKKQSMKIYIKIFLRTLYYPIFSIVWIPTYYFTYYIYYLFKKQDIFVEKIMKEPSIFKSSRPPAAAGKGFKKDIR